MSFHERCFADTTITNKHELELCNVTCRSHRSMSCSRWNKQTNQKFKYSLCIAHQFEMKIAEFETETNVQSIQQEFMNDKRILHTKHKNCKIDSYCRLEHINKRENYRTQGIKSHTQIQCTIKVLQGLFQTRDRVSFVEK